MLIRAMFLLLAVTLSAFAAEPDTANPNLKTAANGVKYYLSLPKGWNDKSTYPILMTLDGSGHNFSGNFNGFNAARGDLPLIVVTPCVSSNGKDPADFKAVLEIVEEVQKSSNGQPKFFITGFSAGGHVAWQIVFTHPELLAGAVLAAGNFRHRGFEEVSKAPERVKLPIQAFLGDKDAYKEAMAQQWDDAVKLAKENGYENLKMTEVPGQGHQAFYKRVVEFIATLLPK